MHAWRTLVHVCRKWRSLAFGSPRRLSLWLCYKARTSLKKTLEVWPPLPIVIWVESPRIWGVNKDNVIVALKHNDRICRIDLWDFPSSQFENVLEVMQQPFPTLSFLVLGLEETVPVIPASFLGGSTAHLQTLALDYIPFPGLPKLLLSATHLVYLYLWRIPQSGYFPPEVMVNCLSVLTRLEVLKFGFKSPRSSVDQNSRYPPPSTRTLLPVLNEFRFRGVSEYLEELVARIDAPLLDDFSVIFFHKPTFDTSQLARFIGRTPNVKAHDEARVNFILREVSVTLPRTFNRSLKLGISYKRASLQLSSLARVCISSFPQRPFFKVSFPQWNTSISSGMKDGIGKMTLGTANGWNFYIHLRP